MYVFQLLLVFECRQMGYLIFRLLSIYYSIPQVNIYIEDCIAQKDPLIKILRLVCMQSVCNNGLKQKVLDYYKREILQVKSKTELLVYDDGVCSYIFLASTKRSSGALLFPTISFSRITQLP